MSIAWGRLVRRSSSEGGRPQERGARSLDPGRVADPLHMCSRIMRVERGIHGGVVPSTLHSADRACGAGTRRLPFLLS